MQTLQLLSQHLTNHQQSQHLTIKLDKKWPISWWWLIFGSQYFFDTMACGRQNLWISTTCGISLFFLNLCKTIIHNKKALLVLLCLSSNSSTISTSCFYLIPFCSSHFFSTFSIFELAFVYYVGVSWIGTLKKKIAQVFSGPVDACNPLSQNKEKIKTLKQEVSSFTTKK